VPVKVDRRSFCLALATAPLTAAGACSTTPPVDTRTALAQLLTLTTPGEVKWLDVLSPDEQRELQTLLTSAERASRRSINLVMKVIGRRERLFAYVGYPPLERLGACDGLIRE
jgi:hypothetical protein